MSLKTTTQLILFTAMGRQTSIKIFGNDYPTADGTCIRDYVHVSDLADAHVAAVEWLAAGNSSETFNLGNGQGVSVAEVVKAVERITGKEIVVDNRARRPGDPPILISDSAKAMRILGWKPQFPDVDHQVAHAWKWFRERD